MVFDNLGALAAYKIYKSGHTKFANYAKFKHYYQFEAYEAGFEIEDAVKFKYHWQVIEVVENKVPIDHVIKYQWHLPKFKHKDIAPFDGIKQHQELSALIKENFELININSHECELVHRHYDMSGDGLLLSVYCDVKELLDTTNKSQTIDHIEE
ncbi:hypothetical protein [Rickettsiales endosymbiont of Trichoplax sp. H2]|uniref:hypothetical protein n=1 Tax=Rickettsiales endosymbiont of Trichoplax sp. H2 TaxID=2021221 RepID=UPI0012B33A4E|nr:hypothetical protein [Rickettsiales endosymbiont of Trichoplax sp. H2]MSO13551.1 hypothetical protein [Rickettsiales endosymbiont of Trichoplax sp. H2]